MSDIKLGKIMSWQKKCIAAAAKKDQRYKTFENQSYQKKIKNGKLVPIHDYQRVLKSAKKNFVLCIKQFITAEKECFGFANVAHRIPEEVLSNALWKANIHMMFYSGGQRPNQYENILTSNISLTLLVKNVPTGNWIIEKNVILDVNHENFPEDGEAKIREILVAAQDKPDSHQVEIRIRSPNFDKVERRSTYSHFCWGATSLIEIKCIACYFLHVLPKLKGVATALRIPYTDGYAFVHTKRFNALTKQSLFQTMKQHYDFTARQEKFAPLHEKATAYCWRHSWVTFQDQEWIQGRLHKECITKDDFFEKIARMVNSGADEIRNVYTTRFNANERNPLSLPAPISIIDLTLDEMEESEHDQSEDETSSTNHEEQSAGGTGEKEWEG